MSQIKLTAAGGGGTVALKGPSSTTGNAAIELTVPGTASGTLATTATAGKILQVVSSTKTDAWSQTANTTAGTDIPGTDQSGSGSVFCVKITPSATSSKILFTTSITIGMGSGAAYVQAFMMRGSTVLLPSTVISSGSGVNATFGLSGTGSAYYTENMNFTFLDSPNSTSELTYKVQLGKGDGGYTFYLNRPATLDGYAYNTAGSSTVTVMEVAA